jgi:Asp-tRNA(Asn)/Glu-tRNA(Gln) amidotransferase A subunit family amidase
LTPPRFRRWTVEDFYKGYRAGKFTPVDVANAFIAAVKQSDSVQPPLRAVIQFNETAILQQARDSADRIKNGKALSALDGVPVLFKEEIDVAGFVPCRSRACPGLTIVFLRYLNTYGTNGRIIGKVPIEVDAPLVDRLRKTGAMFVGKGSTSVRSPPQRCYLLSLSQTCMNLVSFRLA